MGQTCKTCTESSTDYSKRDMQKQRLMVTTAEGDDLTRVSVSVSSTTRPLDDAQLGNLIGMMADNQHMMLGTPTAPDTSMTVNDRFADANAGKPINTRGSMYEMSAEQAMQFQTVDAKPHLRSMGSAVDVAMSSPPTQTAPTAVGNGGGDSDLDTESESDESDSDASTASDDSEMAAMREQMAAFQAQIQSQMKTVDGDSSLSQAEKVEKKKVVRQQSLYKWSSTQIRATQSDMEKQLALLSKQLGGGEDPSSISAIMAQRKKEQEEQHIQPMEKRHRKKKRKKSAEPIIEEGDEEEVDELK